MLTGSPMLGFMLDAMADRFLLTLTLPSTRPHHNRSTNDMGAAHAIGRMHQAADRLTWALDRPGLMDRVASRTEECIAPQWTGKDVEEGLVRPLRMERQDHMPGKCRWRPPFEAMGLMGLAIASRAGSEAAYTVGHAVVRLLLKYGLKPNLEPIWGVHWFERAPGVYSTDPSLFQVGGGRWGEWAAGFLSGGLISRGRSARRRSTSASSRWCALQVAATARPPRTTSIPSGPGCVTWSGSGGCPRPRPQTGRSSKEKRGRRSRHEERNDP